jgi:flagellar hook protein FlgE
MHRLILALLTSLAFASVAVAGMPGTPEEALAGSLVNGWQQGGLRVTDRTFDLAIQGAGFFVLQHPNDRERWAYTRVGAFEMDNAGFLVQSGTGLKVFGYADSKIDRFLPINLALAARSAQSAPVKSFRIGLNGEIKAAYADGTVATVAFVALALMPNARRLSRIAEHLYEIDRSSGSAYCAPAQVDGRGSVYAASLEELDGLEP